MDLIVLGPMSAGGYAWQPRFGGHAFVVIVKVTFALRQGEARLADVQDHLTDRDNHWNDDPNCSVYAPSDMAPFKERVDVSLVGDAFAPTPNGSHSLVARLAVGDIDKRVVVFADRQRNGHGRLERGAPFHRMALRYERAARAEDNPVGRAAEPDGDGRRVLPNLQPSKPAAGALRSGGAACFGPVAAGWPSRSERLGRAARAWRDPAWRAEPLPADLDPTYFNDAPPDQRIDELRPDEQIVLHHLHPHMARLCSHLPGLQPRAFVERGARGHDGQEVPLTADSLWIDMTRGVCTVTWRGSFEIASPAEHGRVLCAIEEADERLTWEDLARLDLYRGERTSALRLIPACSSFSPVGPVSGFAPSHAPPSFQPMPVSSQIAAARVQMPTLDLAVGADITETMSLPIGPALPFSNGPHLTVASHAVTAAHPAWAMSSPPSFGPATPPSMTLRSYPGAALGTVTLGSVAEQSYAPSPPSPPPAGPASSRPLLADGHAGPTLVSEGSPISPWVPGGLTARFPVKPPPSPAGLVQPPLLLVPSIGIAQSADGSTAPEPEACADQLDPLDARWRVELVDHEREEYPRVREHWRMFEDEPSDVLAAELKSAFGAPERPSAADAQRHIVRIMTHSIAQSAPRLRHALRDAVDDDGVFEAPLLLCHGVLRFEFDEIETLRATVASVAPYIGSDADLKSAVTAARKVLADSTLGGSKDVAAELTAQVVEATRKSAAVDIAVIDKRVERILLDKRAYRQRQLLGAKWARATLTIGDLSLPCYLPLALASSAPRFSSFTTRVIGELHPRQDQDERSPIALRAIALGRVVPRSVDPSQEVV